MGTAQQKIKNDCIRYLIHDMCVHLTIWTYAMEERTVTLYVFGVVSFRDKLLATTCITVPFRINITVPYTTYNKLGIPCEYSH
jgi:hypothetical protein